MNKVDQVPRKQVVFHVTGVVLLALILSVLFSWVYRTNFGPDYAEEYRYYIVGDIAAASAFGWVCSVVTWLIGFGITDSIKSSRKSSQRNRQPDITQIHLS